MSPITMKVSNEYAYKLVHDYEDPVVTIVFPKEKKKIGRKMDILKR
jgi:hypothetical protein